MVYSIDQLRGQSKVVVVATLHSRRLRYLLSEATAGMTTSALFCYSRCQVPATLHMSNTIPIRNIILAHLSEHIVNNANESP